CSAPCSPHQHLPQRAVHPSPPRRSSDLDELERLPEAPPAAAGEWHLPVWMPDLPESVDRSLPLFRAAAELDDDARRRFFYAFVADRKSTRLNSSHVKISYAVFCLKKKR